MNSPDAPYLEIQQLKKSFGQVQALQGASLSVRKGQILAIVGDNGAGKSTLIKAIAGVLTPDGGRIVINGQEHSHMTPALADAAGVSTVFQDLALVNCQSVWENIFLGHEHQRWGWLDKRRMRREAAELLQRFGIDVPELEAEVGELSGGQRQAVAVARALLRGGDLLIFDEPTAAMGLRETQIIQQLIKNLAGRDIGVILISHNIQQVFSLADRICVMRHGAVLAICDRDAVTPDDIASLIISGAAKTEKA